MVQASQFVVWDVENEVEVVRTAAGNWRRPVAVHLESSRCFTFALLKEQQVKVVARTVAASPLRPAPVPTAKVLMHSPRPLRQLATRRERPCRTGCWFCSLRITAELCMTACACRSGRGSLLP